MSVYRSEQKLSEDDEFTFKDNLIVKKLLESKKLTEKQRQAVQRLLKTYWNMVD